MGTMAIVLPKHSKTKIIAAGLSETIEKAIISRHCEEQSDVAIQKSLLN
jgi:hypothetical protein